MAAKIDDQDSDEGINEINITPFVDVVLVLLVIFMVTAPMMVQQVLEVKLPSAESSDAAAPETIGLAVTAKGQFLLNGKIATEKSVYERAVLAVKKNKDSQVIIAADGESQHKFVIKAIDVIKRAGVENFAFQVNVDKKEDRTPENIDGESDEVTGGLKD